jgi:ElaB/YqjD/DUF883 family membrane-anchored ribosome-binding protein
MGQSADELRQEIDQHRYDAERKINDLQGQIQGTAEDLRTQAEEGVNQIRDQVQNTATDIRDQVQGTVDDTIQSVKDSFDYEQFIQDKPLVSLGAALIGGFVLGGLLNSSGGGGGSQNQSGSSSYSSSSGSQSGIGDSVRNAYKSSGLEDTVSNAAAAMMGSITEQLKQTMDKNMPGFADRMDTAKRTEGSVMDKSRELQP